MEREEILALLPESKKHASPLAMPVRVGEGFQRVGTGKTVCVCVPQSCCVLLSKTAHVGPAPYVMSDASRKDVWDNGRPKVKLDNVLDEIYKKQNSGTQAKKKVAAAILYEEVNMLLITAFTAAFEGHAELSRLLTEDSVKQFKVTTELNDAQVDDPTLMPAV